MTDQRWTPEQLESIVNYGKRDVEVTEAMELVNARARIEELQTGITDDKLVINNLRKEIDNFNQLVDKLKDRNERLQAKVSTLYQRLEDADDLNEELEGCYDVIDSLEDEIANLHCAR